MRLTHVVRYSLPAISCPTSLAQSTGLQRLIRVRVSNVQSGVGLLNGLDSAAKKAGELNHKSFDDAQLTALRPDLIGQSRPVRNDAVHAFAHHGGHLHRVIDRPDQGAALPIMCLTNETAAGEPAVNCKKIRIQLRQVTDSYRR